MIEVVAWVVLAGLGVWFMGWLPYWPYVLGGVALAIVIGCAISRENEETRMLAKYTPPESTFDKWVRRSSLGVLIVLLSSGLAGYIFDWIYQ
jgi:hypothetical protein